MSFSHTCRLVSKADFQSVFNQTPKKLARGPILALYIPSTTPSTRIGIIVAKRHYKRAVDRNLVRRLTRESFRHVSSELPHVDIVFMLRSRFQLLDKSAIRIEIDALWQKLIATSKPV